MKMLLLFLMLFQCHQESAQFSIVSVHCMKKRIFVLRKFVKRVEKIIFSLVFVCFCFTEISYFLSFPSSKNVRNQHLSTNACFCVNIEFSYAIAGCKDETLYCNENKRFFAGVQVNFSLTVFQRKDEIFCRITTKTSHFSTFR